MKHYELSLMPELVNSIIRTDCFKEEYVADNCLILKKYIDSINSHNFEKVKRLLDDEVVFFFTDKKCITLPDIEAYFTEAWSLIEDEVYEAVNPTLVNATSTAKVFTYTFVYSGTTTSGKQISGEGRATNVFMLKKGEWKLVHEHLSNF